MTHACGMAAAWGLYKMRRDVGRISLGFFKHSKRIGLTVLMDVEGSQESIPITLWNAHELSIIEFAKKCDQLVKAKQSSPDNEIYLDYLPSFLLQPFIWSISYANLCLGVSIP